ncbi:LOB domain-containing protein 4-like [Eucalyptus grandis]|uniref:LOB domain-containing protein 4-like n=1 Tax=Eucalyptus grandis TaxID=71139 RepID=UPI00192F047E|nr:LOB domain-containing protein 4-like [Eucalyptus grandis]
MEGGDPLKRKPCAKCRTQKRKCPEDCLLAPYFPAAKRRSFLSVHKVFGSGKVAKALKGLPEDQRAAAASSMVSEADARIKDPVNGCIGEINGLRAEVEMLRGLLAECEPEVARLKALVETGQAKTDPRPNEAGSPLPPA